MRWRKYVDLFIHTSSVHYFWTSKTWRKKIRCHHPPYFINSNVTFLLPARLPVYHILPGGYNLWWYDRTCYSTITYVCTCSTSMGHWLGLAYSIWIIWWKKHCRTIPVIGKFLPHTQTLFLDQIEDIHIYYIDILINSK